MPQAVVGGLSSPEDLAALVTAVQAAAAGGLALHVRGAGRWWPDAPPGSAVVSTSRLDAVSDFNPTDLVVTAGAGAPLDRLAERLAARGAFLALDPPGSPSRTVGGILASASAGPLAAHYGPVRDQVLGLTVVAGDGTVVRLGGRVVKNVAGFDLAKLVLGGHGAFGVIAEAHLRLRAIPPADRTVVWSGSAAWAEDAAAAALAAGATPAALEITSPELSAALGWGDGWSLAARALGGPAGVDEELGLVEHAAGARCRTRGEGDAAWLEWRRVVGSWPAVLRIGADPARWSEAVELTRRHVSDVLGASVTAPRGTVRVGARSLDAAAVGRLRAEAAERSWPVTLERADPATRAAVGVWGALPAGAERLARELGRLFDPAGTLAVPLLS